MPETAGSELVKIDGRRARGLRTRDAIVTSLLELVGQGETSPTLQRIASGAGVSIRSVYQHFLDVDDLFGQAATQLLGWAAETEEDIDPGLPLPKRIRIYVRTRTEVLEALSPFCRAARSPGPSRHVREARAILHEQQRKRLASVFGPELDRRRGLARDHLLSSLELVTVWSAWNHLRASGASVRAARLVLESTLAGLLDGPYELDGGRSGG